MLRSSEGTSRVEEADKMEVRFRGSKGDQEGKEAMLVRAVDPARRERGGVELLVELT